MSSEREIFGHEVSRANSKTMQSVSRLGAEKTRSTTDIPATHRWAHLYLDDSSYYVAVRDFSCTRLRIGLDPHPGANRSNQEKQSRADRRRPTPTTRKNAKKTNLGESNRALLTERSIGQRLHQPQLPILFQKCVVLSFGCSLIGTTNLQ